MKKIVSEMCKFFKYFDENMSIGSIAEFKSKEYDSFFQECIGDTSKYTSIVEGTVGTIPFKTYVDDIYMYVVSDDFCVGLYIDVDKSNRNLRIFRKNAKKFYQFSNSIYSDEIVFRQILSDNKKISESISKINNKTADGTFLMLIGMNIPNQYFSDECRNIIGCSSLYKTKMAYETVIDDSRCVVNTTSYWTNIDKFKKSDKPSIIELDLIMSGIFQKSLFVMGDNGNYNDLYNSSGLSMSYDEVSKLLSKNNISIYNTSEFVAIVDTNILIPEKLDKLCNIVSVAKLAKVLNVDISFSSVDNEK